MHDSRWIDWAHLLEHLLRVQFLDWAVCCVFTFYFTLLQFIEMQKWVATSSLVPPSCSTRFAVNNLVGEEKEEW